MTAWIVGKKAGFLEIGPRLPRGQDKKIVDIRNGRWDTWFLVGKSWILGKKAGFLEISPRLPRGQDKKIVDIGKGRWDTCFLVGKSWILGKKSWVFGDWSPFTKGLRTKESSFLMLTSVSIRNR